MTLYSIHFYRQLDSSSEPGVAKEILENEPNNCLQLSFIVDFYISEN